MFKRLVYPAALDLSGPRVFEIGAALAGSAASRFRSEIVYAGSVAAEGVPLYALESEIPGLMDDLASALVGLKPGPSPLDVAALMLLIAISIHPFMDGNGRFARFVSIAAARGVGNICSGALVAVLQRFNRPWFVAICMQARSSGLESFLAVYKGAVNTFTGVLERQGVTSCFAALSRLIQASERRREMQACVTDMLLEGQLSHTKVREALSCSNRAAAGIVDSIAASHTLLQREDGGLSPLMDAIGLSASLQHQEK